MSAFFGAELDLELRRQGCNTVVICGVATNMGVEATARATFDLNYNVVIAADACGSVAPGLHEFAVDNILPRIVRLRPTAEIVVYPMPVGGVGVSMVDTRDSGEVAALHLLRREKAAGPLPQETINLVGPDVLTGATIAGIWSEVLERPITYGGDDLAMFEQQRWAYAPSWMAYDMRLMLDRLQRDGLVPDSGDVDRLTTAIGAVVAILP